MKNRTKIIALVCALMLIFAAFGTACFEGKGGNGVTAYEIAVKNGFEGTEAEWLASLNGKDGDNAQTVYSSLYDEAVEKYGYEGSFYDFVEEYCGGYVGSELETSVSSAADRAVLSAVKVVSTFSYQVRTIDRKGNITYSTKEYEGAGSGVIVDLDANGNAYIITNFHVIYDSNDTDGYADKIRLFVYGREMEKHAVEATILGCTATYDIAVLKVENSEIFRSSNLVEAEFFDSNYLGAGDEIFAVGNASGLGIAVTAGIVSVDSEYITMTSPKDNVTSIKYRVARIDAAINAGNSGGALFNLDGKIVGIVNAKVVADNIDNIAYAIPSSLVKNVYENILRNCDGTNKNVITYPIGITVSATDSYAVYDEILHDTRIVQVVEVIGVSTSSTAYGKLQIGDVITSYEYEGETYLVDRLYDVTDGLLMFEANKNVTYSVKRGGEALSVTVKTGSAQTVD